MESYYPPGQKSECLWEMMPEATRRGHYYQVRAFFFQIDEYSFAYKLHSLCKWSEQFLHV